MDRLNMDDSAIRVGPIRKLRDRANLCDYSPSTYQSRVVVGISDLEAPLATLIQRKQKTALLVKHSGPNVSTADVDTALAEPATVPERGPSVRPADGVRIRIITGTGFFYAYTLRQQESIPDDGPPEPAGPLQPGLQVTLSNTLGNMIVYRCQEIIKVWVLRYSSNDVPAWVEANEGDPHPEADALRGYSLSMKNPKKPSWVKSETLQQYQSKGKRRAG